MKEWFWQRFLPMWAKQTLLQDNRELRRENEQLQAKICRLESYIQGLHRGCKRVIIQTGGKRD